MADHASGTIDFHILFFCASRQPLFSAMIDMFFSALRWVVIAIVLAAACDICVDILPASAQQNEINALDQQIEQLQNEYERVQANVADGPILPSVTVDEIRSYLVSRYDFKKELPLDEVVQDAEWRLRT